MEKSLLAECVVVYSGQAEGRGLRMCRRWLRQHLSLSLAPLPVSVNRAYSLSPTLKPTRFKSFKREVTMIG